MNGHSTDDFDPTLEEYERDTQDTTDYAELVALYGDTDEPADTDDDEPTDEEWYQELTQGYYRDIGARR